MTVAARLRILVVHGAPPCPAWHDDVIAHLRAVADVTIDPLSKPDAVVDLSGHFDGPADGARYGVWRYGFGDGAPAANGAAGTLARLYRLAAGGSRGAVLVEGWFRGPSGDAPGSVNVERHVTNWCAHVIRDIAAGDPLARPLVDMGGCAEPAPPAPSTSIVGRGVAAWYRWRRRERWTIGIVQMPLAELLRRDALPEPTWVSGAPANGYWADPFPLSSRGDDLHLLAEEYDDKTGRGSIVALTMTRSGRLRNRVPALTAPHHLAYPFVLRDGDTTACVPDAAASGAIRAFAVTADAAPIGELLSGFAGVDPTLFRHDGRWWLFCTDRGCENQTNLHLFFADDWRGPWTAHALNPVKSDARSSRPAGALFVHDHRLFRPAQDCARRYGSAVALNEIDVLTPTRFRERTIRTFMPDARWSWPDGLHTLNALDDLIVVDGLRVER